MTNQEKADQYINANAHLTDREIFDAARNNGKNRGFLIALAASLIEAAENAANDQSLADQARYMRKINLAFGI